MKVRVDKRKELGAPYTRHALMLDGIQIHCQLSPYSDAEIAARVADYRNPIALPKSDPLKRGKPGPKPGANRSPSVNARGFLWKDNPE
jgi:hypothetical protein